MNEILEKRMREEVENLRAAGLIWDVHELSSASDSRVIMDGKEVLLFCANNYLGLANDPRMKKAALEATEKYGAGSGSVRAIAGTMSLHLELEKKIAKFKHMPASVYYNTGFTANSGAIPQLCVKGTLVLSDELNHGSIIDGVRLSKAERGIYKHSDMEDLRAQLEAAKGKDYSAVYIITDGVFSMDGDLAPVKEIVELAEQYGAITYVDDAHGDGVLGPQGRGIAHHFGVDKRVDFEMGTFSKAFGAMGGFIACSETAAEFLSNKSRTWLLTGSHPPAVVAACIASLDILEESDELVKKLWENTKYFKSQLAEFGFDLGHSETPITPIMTYDEQKARKMSKRLFEEGIFALPIVFPMVAKGKARIRAQVNAAHTREDLDFAIEKMGKIGKELEIIK